METLPISLLSTFILEVGNLSNYWEVEEETLSFYYCLRFMQPTEGAPTPQQCVGRLLAGPGRRRPADLSPGRSWVARAAEVSAESGHSLGRRRKGGRLGHQKGKKSWQGKHSDTHFTETEAR
jgi:hypothetical protein